MPSVLLIFSIFIPIIMGIIIMVYKPKNKLNTKTFVISTVIINLLIVVVVNFFFINYKIDITHMHNLLNLSFSNDLMGGLFSVLISVLWILTTVYTFCYMKKEKKKRRFYGFFIVTLGVTLGIAFSANLFTLYIFYEALTLVTFPLVIHKGTKEAIHSGKKYLIYSFSGAALVLLGFVLLFPAVNTLDFSTGGIIIKGAVSNSYLLMVFTIMFIGFGVKAAIFPFYSWLPSAMVAPTPVSALLHAVAVVNSGIFALVRLIYFIFGSQVVKDVNGIKYVGVLVGLTVIFGSLLAVGEKNLKKKLAFSTISQLGYIMLGLILLNEDAFTGGILHFIFHAMIKITLFFCVGAIMKVTGKKSLDDIKGLGKEMPITMVCFTISALALMGTPPTNGFISKWYLAIGGLGANYILFTILLLISALLTAAYILPIPIYAFFGGNSDKEYEKREAPAPMLIPIIVLTILNLLLGFFPSMILKFIKLIASQII